MLRRGRSSTTGDDFTIVINEFKALIQNLNANADTTENINTIHNGLSPFLEKSKNENMFRQANILQLALMLIKGLNPENYQQITASLSKKLNSKKLLEDFIELRKELEHNSFNIAEALLIVALGLTEHFNYALNTCQQIYPEVHKHLCEKIQTDFPEYPNNTNEEIASIYSHFLQHADTEEKVVYLFNKFTADFELTADFLALFNIQLTSQEFPEGHLAILPMEYAKKFNSSPQKLFSLVQILLEQYPYKTGRELAIDIIYRYGNLTLFDCALAMPSQLHTNAFNFIVENALFRNINDFLTLLNRCQTAEQIKLMLAEKISGTKEELLGTVRYKTVIAEQLNIFRFSTFMPLPENERTQYWYNNANELNALLTWINSNDPELPAIFTTTPEKVFLISFKEDFLAFIQTQLLTLQTSVVTSPHNTSGRQRAQTDAVIKHTATKQQTNAAPGRKSEGGIPNPTRKNSRTGFWEIERSPSVLTNSDQSQKGIKAPTPSYEDF